MIVVTHVSEHTTGQHSELVSQSESDELLPDPSLTLDDNDDPELSLDVELVLLGELGLLDDESELTLLELLGDDGEDGLLDELEELDELELLLVDGELGGLDGGSSSPQQSRNVRLPSIRISSSSSSNRFSRRNSHRNSHTS